ncbi:DUF397 domain-containing protein [Nocardiopsis sediminis]|uniref:DUF397 domain-containing protein n=1 Tax=Nocardiopsis sediminis TaxID=1778267 RepID=A0ABV8FMU5_9ACTN
MLNEKWIKSSRSNAGGSCVEARTDRGVQVQIRDTQNRERGSLVFPASEWRALLTDIDSL